MILKRASQLPEKIVFPGLFRNLERKSKTKIIASIRFLISQAISTRHEGFQIISDNFEIALDAGMIST